MKNIIFLALTISLFAVLLISCGGSGDNDSCPDSNKFCNYYNGLNWSDASSDTMIWDEAKTYCLNLGGRMPTISELRTLIKNCPGTVTDGECGVTDDCLISYPDTDSCDNDACLECIYGNYGKGIYSVFGDESYFWSSSKVADSTVNIWIIDFYDGSINSIYTKNSTFYTRCVF